MKRLVITGMGAVTPIGIGVNAYWKNLLAGKCGIGPITRFDASRLPTRIAAEIHDFNSSCSFPKSVCRSSSLFMLYAYAAAEEALSNAGIRPHENTSEIGICMGTALGGAAEMAQAGIDWECSATGKISPHLVPRAINNMICAHLGINWGLRGPGLTLDTACSAGGDAIMSAAMLILTDQADAVLVVGGESIITPSLVSSLCQARALSRRNDAPCEASRPFDSDRDGFVIGEGGGAIILESEESARKRNAPVLAQLAGWANTLDGYHITAPDPEGAGAAKCMRRALHNAGMAPGEIGYINAHGTATRLGDIAESKAIAEVFGDSAPPVSSTKGATGHLMGAGGLTELIACVKSIHENIIPPTLNLQNPDPLCQLDIVAINARKATIHAAMTNSLGFGGQNSSIIITAPD